VLVVLEVVELVLDSVPELVLDPAPELEGRKNIQGTGTSFSPEVLEELRELFGLVLLLLGLVLLVLLGLVLLLVLELVPLDDVLELPD